MPKITAIEVKSLEYVLPKGSGYGNARGINNRRGCSLIAVRTDDDVTGFGDATGPLGVVREYVKVLAPFFVGHSLYDFAALASNARNRLYHFGSQGAFVSSLGGIDIAFHDAMGKTLNLPVCELIGGRTGQEISCYGTTGYFTDNPQVDIQAQISALDLSLFKGIKIKIGASVTSDVERVRATREVIGDDMLLMVDMNGNYTVDAALESLRRLEPFDIHWCEEPLPPSDIAGYAELRGRSPIRLAAGEAHYGVHDFKRLIEARAIDIVQPSLTGGGGFVEMKAVTQLAAMNNIRVSPACWGSAVALNAAVHFAASLPTGPHTTNAPYPFFVEYDVADNPLRDLLTHNAIRPVAGSLPIPAGPGLGLDLNTDTIAKYGVDRNSK